MSAPARVTPRSVSCAGFVALTAFASAALAAPQKVSELSTDLFNGSSAPAGFQVLDGAMLFFSRSGPVPGLGLFRSDGTAAGTVLVRDLDPKVRIDGTAPHIVILNGRGYWSQGGSLWVTDGTPAGTQVIAMFGSTLGDDPTEPVVFHNALYFGGGGSLHRSDGTPAGTQVLAPTISPVGRWQEMGGRLYFTCAVGTVGIELCATDGTALGTAMVRDLFPGIQSSDPIFLGVVGSRLLFSAVTDPQFFMRGLWSSDGTAAGTQELVAPPGDRFQDAIDRFEQPAAVLGAHAYIPCFTLQTGFELCRTDGTPAGTSVLDVVPGQGSLFPSRVVALGARLIFIAFDAAAGSELWTSNGTVAGTSRLVDLLPGPSDGVNGGLIPVGSTAYFAGRSAVGDPFELWKTDGTGAGTVRVARIVQPNLPERFPLVLSERAVLGPRLFFAADDGATALEPWVTDGTAAGTHLVKELLPTRSSAHVTEMVALRGAHYLAVDSGANTRLWKTDGTAAGTAIFQTGRVAGLTAVDHWLYYGVIDSSRTALWKSDGTIPGTTKLRDLPGTAEELHAFGRRLVFAGTTPSQSRGLWFSDGTTAGTAPTEPPLINASGLGVANGGVWLGASAGGLNNELFTSDGSSAGTRLVKDIYVGVGSSFPHGFVELGDQTVFVADDGLSGREIWKTDGTADGTVRVADINPGSVGSFPADLFAWNGIVLFTAANASGRALWKTDGTPAGTVMLKRFAPAFETRFVPWGSHVFFAAADAADAAGTELWRTDGTPAGTVMVSDIYPGPLPSNPSLLVLAGRDGPLVFAAEEPLAGREIWTLARPLGTPELLADIAPGPASSAPTFLGLQGSSLIATADDGTGYALWRLDGIGPDGVPPVVTCPSDVTVATMNASGASATFPPAAATDSSGPPSVTADHASGDIFPVGTTVVHVVATDSSNNAAGCSFTVNVMLHQQMPDAGPIDAPPDAGSDPMPPDPLPPDGGNAEAPGGEGPAAGGCACGATGASTWPNILVLAFVAIAVRRRRR